MRRIAEQRIEVHDCVELPAPGTSNPAVDLLAKAVLRGTVVALQRGALERALERGDRRTDDADVARMRSRDELPVPRDQLGGTNGVLEGREGVAGPAYVVDPHDENDGADAGLSEDITVEAVETVLTLAPPQHAPAGDAVVHHGHAVPHEPLGEEVRPPVVALQRRADAVGDRVAVADHRLR